MENKRSPTPGIVRGFHPAIDNLRPLGIIVYPDAKAYPLLSSIEVSPLRTISAMISEL
ncbi:hypothetical protein GCM10007420_21700 [Glycocaulis albus]|uniref:Uncharacterized protein n=1 Tax=Glycocaulis albus TaxID=1382801 RepID=A0ABQ1XVV9_9PROT|nr:hypothetical protein GCM10007420_21700 [Glycocaulis albus]